MKKRVSLLVVAMVVVAIITFGALGASAFSQTPTKPKKLPTQTKTEAFAAIDPTSPPLPAAPSVAPPTAAAANAASTLQFDPVPSNLVEPLLKRLKIVEALIQRHGRAYDYKLLTVQQLETLLTTLDARLPPIPATRELPAPESVADSDLDAQAI